VVIREERRELDCLLVLLLPAAIVGYTPPSLPPSLPTYLMVNTGTG